MTMKGVKEISTNLYKVDDNAFDDFVLKSDLPVIVDFYADWCSPCKIIAPVLEEMARDYEGRAKFVKIDVDINNQTAIKYRVRAVPTLMLFNNGDLCDTMVGAIPRGRLEEALGRINV